MSDERSGGLWTLDPETRQALRIGRVQRAIEGKHWTEAILEAEELLDEIPDHSEALALLGHALLESGDAQVAVLVLDQAIRCGRDEIATLLSLAIARFEICDLVGAVEVAREVIRRSPSCAEGHWYLGLSLERLPGGQAEAVTELAAARQLEPEHYPWPIQLEPDEWNTAVQDALKLVHPTIESFWYGVEMRFEALPSLQELREMDPPASPAVSGLFHGTLDPTLDPIQQRPEALRLFTRNLSLCRDYREVVEHITIALESEALGWLGIEDVTELG